MGPAARGERLVALISGRGSNALAILEASRDGRLCSHLIAAISDRPAPGLSELAGRGLDTVELPRDAFPDRAAFERELTDVIVAFAPDRIVLAGFMRVLSGDFVRHHAGRLVNIHPSLLPAYRGLDTHRRVLEAGDPVHGASVHFVVPELDAGPVIAQAVIEVVGDDTPGSLAERLLGHEHRLYPATLALLSRHSVELRDGAIFVDDQELSRPLLLGHDLDDAGRFLTR